MGKMGTKLFAIKKKEEREHICKTLREGGLNDLAEIINGDSGDVRMYYFENKSHKAYSIFEQLKPTKKDLISYKNPTAIRFIK